MPGLTINTPSGAINITPQDGAGTANITLSRKGFGKVLGVTRTLVTTQSTQVINTTPVNVPGVAATVSPASVNSYFSIYCRWFGEVNSAWDCGLGVRRNGIDLSLPNARSSSNRVLAIPAQSYGSAADDNSTPEHGNFITMDYPATTASLTYTLTMNSNSSRTAYHGMTIGNSGFNYEVGSLEIIVTEYAG
jgi:hypothetical protein